MAKFGKVINEPDTFLFNCPACGVCHYIDSRWKFDGNIDTPTVTGSILVNKGSLRPDDPVCHSFITDGQIKFEKDSTHALAGQTVDLPDWE
jgi:hypothetical protein